MSADLIRVYVEGLAKIAEYVDQHPGFAAAGWKADYRVHCNDPARFDALVAELGPDVDIEYVEEYTTVSRDFGGARLVVQKYTAAVAA